MKIQGIVDDRRSKYLCKEERGVLEGTYVDSRWKRKKNFGGRMAPQVLYGAAINDKIERFVVLESSKTK